MRSLLDLEWKNGDLTVIRMYGRYFWLSFICGSRQVTTPLYILHLSAELTRDDRGIQGRWSKMHFRGFVTYLLPSLKPTVIILLLFALGGIVKGNFGLFYNIIGTNSLLYDTTDIIETFVYRATMTDFNFSTASAVGLYQSVVGFVIVMVVNYIVKKIEPDYSLF